MSNKKLFDLKNFGIEYDGLYFDENLLLWRKEGDGEFSNVRRLASQDNWPNSHRFRYSLPNLDVFRETISKDLKFVVFKKNCKRKVVVNGSFIVGVINPDETLEFSKFPVIYKSFDAAKNAIENALNVVSPTSETKCVIFECKAIARYDKVKWE